MLPVREALLKARWWAQDYAYAAYWQVRASFNRTDPSLFSDGALVPIVVLPGVYESWKFMQPLIARLHARGHPVHVVELLENNRRPVAEMAQHVTEHLRRHELSNVIFVAHSKGGLAGKLAMLGPEGGRVERMLAIATPFGGSRYARFMPLRSLRAFSPMDPSIQSLARERAVNARIVSVYAGFDPHIPEGSELPGATNVRLDTGGHFRILADDRVLDELARLAV